jgi:hypothetical protein
MKYVFIDEHRSGLRVKKMFRVLDVSPKKSAGSLLNIVTFSKAPKGGAGS